MWVKVQFLGDSTPDKDTGSEKRNSRKPNTVADYSEIWLLPENKKYIFRNCLVG